MLPAANPLSPAGAAALRVVASSLAAAGAPSAALNTAAALRPVVVVATAMETCGLHPPAASTSAHAAVDMGENQHVQRPPPRTPQQQRVPAWARLLPPGDQAAAGLVPSASSSRGPPLLPFHQRFRQTFPSEMYDKLAQLAGSRRDRARPMVDLGCGDGLTSLELLRRGFAVTGLETDAGALARARSRAASLPQQPDFVGGGGGSLAELAAHGVGGGCAALVTLLHPSAPLRGPVGARLLRGARSLLAPKGMLAVAWNDRDLAHPFCDELEALLEEQVQGYVRGSQGHDAWAWAGQLAGPGSGLRLRALSSHANPLLLPASRPAAAIVGSLVSHAAQADAPLPHQCDLSHRALVRGASALLARYRVELGVLADGVDAERQLRDALRTAHRSAGGPGVGSSVLSELALPVVTKMVVLERCEDGLEA
mmetsp:Transcript_31783/g.94862  ORF Transcript_31783/g.94862 Transcript_31783/m.94862 type:complete len:425 (-) Transcript_31783:364-1638(-)